MTYKEVNSLKIGNTIQKKKIIIWSISFTVMIWLINLILRKNKSMIWIINQICKERKTNLKIERMKNNSKLINNNKALILKSKLFN